MPDIIPARRKLLSNRARCNQCQDIVESLHRHDYRSCSCGQLAVDGGRAYAKRNFTGAGFTEMSEYKEIEDDESTTAKTDTLH